MAASPVEDLLLVATGASRLVSLDLNRIDALQVKRAPCAATPPTHPPTPRYPHPHPLSLKPMQIEALSVATQGHPQLEALVGHAASSSGTPS